MRSALVREQTRTHIFLSLLKSPKTYQELEAEMKRNGANIRKHVGILQQMGLAEVHGRQETESGRWRLVFGPGPAVKEWARRRDE